MLENGGMPTNRRGFLLRALSLAPGALAACAGGGAAARPGGSAPVGAHPEPAPAVPATASLERLREFALGGAAEPAFTFRASIVRTGER